MTDPIQHPHPLSAVVDRLERLAHTDHVRIGDLIAAFGATSFVPALMIPAILVVSPLSGIPLFSSICGLTIALISAQMLAQRGHLWLPGFLKNRTVPGQRLAKALDRIGRPVAWIDRHSAARLRLLFHRPLRVIPYLMAMTSGLAMPFLELVPFSSSILGTAVLFISVGLLAADGLFVVFAGVIMAIAAMIPITIWGHLAG